MADETEEHIDADYSGHPYRMPSVEECLEYASTNPQTAARQEDCIGMTLPDGRFVIMGPGSYSTAKWFLRGEDGEPDFDQPIDIKAELNKAGSLTLRPPER